MSKIFLGAASFLLLLHLAAAAVPPSPRHFFGEGAFEYTEAELDQALETVNQGLALYPDDTRLFLLKELLERKQEEQQQDQQNQQDQDEQEQQENQEENQQENQEDQQEDQDEQPPQEDRDTQPQEPEQPRDAQPEPADITPGEAERLLDALRDEEQARRPEMTRKLLGPREPPLNAKDW